MAGNDLSGNDFQSGLHHSRCAGSLLQVSASSHGIRMPVPDRPIAIGVLIIPGETFANQQIVGFGVETIEMGDSLVIEVRCQECRWRVHSKGRNPPLCLMPCEKTNRVLP